MTFNIAFDYRFDDTGFFDSSARRAALEEAGRIWSSIIQDEFTDVPAGVRFTVDDPSNAGLRRSVILEEPIDDILVFVGAESLGGSLAVAGFDGTGAEGDIFGARISGDWRGTGPVTDFEPWAGTISFDPDKAWSFDIDGPVRGFNDFLTTALHEIGHILGIGTSATFRQIGAGGMFDGPNALTVNGGQPIPLTPDLGHVVDGFDGNSVLLDPTSITGTRTLPSDVDRALLADIGYEIDGFTAQGFTPSIATDGADGAIFGTVVNDLIDGRGGNDWIQGNDGDDDLRGGDGDDTLFGQDGNDRLAGGAGDDHLQGGAGDDLLIGGGGADTLFGQEGTDRFRIEAGGGASRIIGFDLSSEVIEIVGTQFSNREQAVESLSKPFSNVSRLTLSDGTYIEVLHGSQSGSPLTAANFALLGAEAGRLLTGTSGTDRLTGGPGDDTILGGDGADTLIGGAGNDSIVGGGTDADLRDMVSAGAGDDTVLGGAGNDELRGDAGDDDIAGGAGADTVIGGTGDDVLTGAAFGDLLFGGDGFDFVNGGFGNDRVSGGGDADQFFHVGVAGHGSDWIQDYSAAEGDVLVHGGSAILSQFQVNVANTAGAGAEGTDEAFVIFRPTGQILWALVDGAGQDEINLRVGGVEYDLLA